MKKPHAKGTKRKKTEKKTNAEHRTPNAERRMPAENGESVARVEVGRTGSAPAKGESGAGVGVQGDLNGAAFEAETSIVIAPVQRVVRFLAVNGAMAGQTVEKKCSWRRRTKFDENLFKGYAGRFRLGKQLGTDCFEVTEV